MPSSRLVALCRRLDSESSLCQRPTALHIDLAVAKFRASAAFVERLLAKVSKFLVVAATTAMSKYVAHGQSNADLSSPHHHLWIKADSRMDLWQAGRGMGRSTSCDAVVCKARASLS